MNHLFCSGLAAFALLCASGCASPPEASQVRQDPFSAGPSFDSSDPARALVALSLPGDEVGGDGSARPLFALARELADDVQIVAADGAGALFEQKPVSAGDGPRDVAALDVDGDGARDIVSADTGSSTLTVMRRTSNDDFVVAASVDTASPPIRLSTADIDGDGLLDIVASVGLGPEGAVAVWTAGEGSLALHGDPVSLPGASRLATGDLDGDGDSDVAVVFSDGLALLRNDGGTLVIAATLGSPCNSLSAVAMADLDGDSLAGVLLACDAEALVIQDPLGSGDSRLHLPVGGRLDDVLAADLDGDGSLDVAAVDVVTHTAAIWLSPAAGPAAGPFLHPVARGPVAISVADLERDGDVDLLVLGYEERRVDILRNSSVE